MDTFQSQEGGCSALQSCTAGAQCAWAGKKQQQGLNTESNHRKCSNLQDIPPSLYFFVELYVGMGPVLALPVQEKLVQTRKSPTEGHQDD